MNFAKWATFQNRLKKAGGRGLGEIESLARKVNRWRLSGQARQVWKAGGMCRQRKRSISEVWWLPEAQEQARIEMLPNTDRPGNQCLSSLAEAWAKVQPRPAGSGEAPASSLFQTALGLGHPARPT